MSQFGTDDPLAIARRPGGGIQLRLLNTVDRLVSISSELSASARACGLAGKLVEIPNGVDTARFAPVPPAAREQLRRDLGLPARDVVVLFVGLIKDRKGIDLLVDAWCAYQKQLSGARLLLLGPRDFSTPGVTTIDEPFIRRLETTIEQAGLTDRILFLGYQRNVVPYLQASDLFVFPSRREGLPNALLEAMSCGLPCVATRLPCLADFIESGRNGLLFEPENGEQLATSLMELARDPAGRQKLGQAARATVEARFSLDQVADRYRALYEGLMNRRGV